MSTSSKSWIVGEIGGTFILVFFGIGSVMAAVSLSTLIPGSFRSPPSGASG